MIKVTIWTEDIQETMTEEKLRFLPFPVDEAGKEFFLRTAEKIHEVHPNGMHQTLKDLLEEDSEICVCHISHVGDPDNGLTEEILNDTDVLIWWAHIVHDWVSDEAADRVVDHVQRGMGFIALHSAHPCKPLKKLLGTTGTLQWREGDFCRVWNVCPTHPIAEGIPAYFELETEEMYGEFFDIPKPDDNVFISWYRGGEVFRSGCTWTRGYGKIFYFQPGHETNPSYYNEYVRRIIRNAVKWAQPTIRTDAFSCPNAVESPEERCQKQQ